MKTKKVKRFCVKLYMVLRITFESIFGLFVKNTSETKTYRGFQLLAVDGSDFLTATNPDAPDSFFAGTEKPKNI